MKDNLEYVVERKRNAELEAVAMLIKKRITGYLQRKKYLKIRNDIITIQKNYKVSTHMLLFISVFFFSTLCFDYQGLIYLWFPSISV